MNLIFSNGESLPVGARFVMLLFIINLDYPYYSYQNYPHETIIYTPA